MSPLAAPEPPRGFNAHRVYVDNQGRAFIVAQAQNIANRIYLDVHAEQGEDDPLHMFVDTYACSSRGCCVQFPYSDRGYDDEGNPLCPKHFRGWRDAQVPTPEPKVPTPTPPPDLCKLCGMDFLGDLAEQRCLYNGLPHHKACAKTARSREFK